MSAAEEDTELRDLLIQNLENNGVLSKIKAELRAAVFLALEQQDRAESKTPLINESLQKCLSTKDGRLGVSMVADFLQVFNLDFTLAVFQPEINTLNGLDSRESVARELGIADPDHLKGSPLLLELIKKCRHKEKPSVLPEELTTKQIADARRKFDFYDKNKRGEISKEQIRPLFSDLLPSFHKNMLEAYVTDEMKDFNKRLDFPAFLGMYKHLFAQCRNVLSIVGCEGIQAPSKLAEDKILPPLSSKIPRYKGIIKHSEEVEAASPQAPEVSLSSSSSASDSMKTKDKIQISIPETRKDGIRSVEGDPLLDRAGLVIGVEEDQDEGDSFFDDPLPKPQKTYGCSRSVGDQSSSGSHSKKCSSQKDVGQPQKDAKASAGALCHMRKTSCLSDLSAINSDTEDDAGDPFSDNANGGQFSPEHEGRRADPGRPSGSPLASLSDAPPSKSVSGSHIKDPLPGDSLHTRSKDDYDDDFNSISHRSDISKSEASIGEEIEEVSIEGPDGSDKLDDLTQDFSVSQLSQPVDYMEDVS